MPCAEMAGGVVDGPVTALPRDAGKALRHLALHALPALSHLRAGAAPENRVREKKQGASENPNGVSENDPFGSVPALLRTEALG